jgi:hypothetical protein
MNALQPNDLDTDTKTRLFQHIADMVAEEIGATPTTVDPGSYILFVNEWWAEVVVDGYNQLLRTDAAEAQVESIIGLHIHGVPVQPDKEAGVPTVREPVGVEGEVDMGYGPNKRLVINEDVEVDAEELVAELEREREE